MLYSSKYFQLKKTAVEFHQGDVIKALSPRRCTKAMSPRRCHQGDVGQCSTSTDYADLESLSSGKIHEQLLLKKFIHYHAIKSGISVMTPGNVTIKEGLDPPPQDGQHDLINEHYKWLLQTRGHILPSCRRLFD